MGQMKHTIKQSPPVKPMRPTLKQKKSDPTTPNQSFSEEEKDESANDQHFLYPNLRHILPTMGQNVKIMEFDNMRLQFWDLPGQTNFRKIWTHYYKEVHGIVFMIDSADTDRLKEVRNELHKLLNEYELKYAPILILSNKQDLKQAVDYQSIINTLQIVSSHRVSEIDHLGNKYQANKSTQDDHVRLQSIDEQQQQKFSPLNDNVFKDRSIKVMCTCCLNKQGLSDAISWLVFTIPLCKNRIDYVAQFQQKQN